MFDKHADGPRQGPTHCNTLQHTATHCNTLQNFLLISTPYRLCQLVPAFTSHLAAKSPQHTATHCNTLQHTATTLQYAAAHCHTLQHSASHCNTLQHTATHCSTLQHIPTHCNTLQAMPVSARSHISSCRQKPAAVAGTGGTLARQFRVLSLQWHQSAGA